MRAYLTVSCAPAMEPFGSFAPNRIHRGASHSRNALGSLFSLHCAPRCCVCAIRLLRARNRVIAIAQSNAIANAQSDYCERAIGVIASAQSESLRAHPDIITRVATPLEFCGRVSSTQR